MFGSLSIEIIVFLIIHSSIDSAQPTERVELAPENGQVVKRDSRP